MDNPFGKKPPAKLQVQGPNMEVSEDVANLCPFIGVFTVIRPPSMVNPSAPPTMEPILTPCVEARCAMWNPETATCRVSEGMAALVELKGKLGKLALFG